MTKERYTSRNGEIQKVSYECAMPVIVRFCVSFLGCLDMLKRSIITFPILGNPIKSLSEYKRITALAKNRYTPNLSIVECVF